MLQMSSDLRAILHRVVEEDYESVEVAIDERLERFKSLILQIAKAKKWHLLIWAETGAKRLEGT